MKLSSFLHFAGFGIKTVLFRKKEPIRLNKPPDDLEVDSEAGCKEAK